MLHHGKGAGSELEDSCLQAPGRGGLHILSSKAMDYWPCTKKPSSRTVRFSRTVRLGLGTSARSCGPIPAWSPSCGPTNSGLCQLRLNWSALGDKATRTKISKNGLALPNPDLPLLNAPTVASGRCCRLSIFDDNDATVIPQVVFSPLLRAR
jgi:hypothetical protein